MRLKTYNYLAATLLLASILAAGGCVYKVNIQQGNLLDRELIDQINVGMTRTQVRFLLGTPLVNNPFRDDVWEYYYYFKVGKTGNTISQRVTVFFEGDVVSMVDKPDQGTDS